MSAARVARAAAVIAILTVASRLAGFGRVVVFNWSVGTTDLGDAYQAANTVPNIVFEIVAGGALAGLVVPLLAGAAARGDREHVARTVSALLTWVVVVLVPVALVVALASRPLVVALLEDANPAAVAAGTRMLRIFAPQLPLYGIGIVLTGVLQTYRRFAWPVLAPLLSSVTVAGAYLTFAVVAGRGVAAGRVGEAGLLVLSIGTTVGVAVLSLCLLVPLRRLGLRLRPGLRMAPETAAAVRRLAGAGVVTVVAQQASLTLAIALAGRGPDGSVVTYALTQTVFLLPWAVLAVPVATSAYPGLAPALRSVLLLSGVGTAGLVAVAGPAGRILVAVTAHPPPPGVIADATAAAAPGLLGYGLFALLSRALYARSANRLAAVTTAAGWSAVAFASLALAAALPDADRVPALSAANSIGLTLLGGLLLAAVAARAGRAALAGAGRAAAVTLLATVTAAAAGLAAAVPLRALWPVGGWRGGVPPTVGAAVTQGILGGLVVVLVYAAVAVATDRRDTRPMVAGLLRRLPRRPARGTGGGTRR